MVQDEFPVPLVGVLVEMVYPVGIEKRRPPFNAVDDIALLQQELGKVRTVLSCHPGNQSCLVHSVPPAPRRCPLL